MNLLNEMSFVIRQFGDVYLRKQREGQFGNKKGVTAFLDKRDLVRQRAS